MGIEEVLTAPHAPWQDPFVEGFLDPLVVNVWITSSCSTKQVCSG
jgi:hypothetical protein